MFELKCNICGKMIKRKAYKVNRAEKHYCSNDCRYKGQRGRKRQYRIEDGFVYLDLPNGSTAKFDVINNDLVDSNWYSQNGYVIRKDNERKYVYMHRVVLERKIGRHLEYNEEADHINGIRSDNTKENLRLANRSENCANLIKSQRTDDNSAKYKGVNFDKYSKKYRARITIGGVTIHLGYFGTERDAAIEYDKAAIRYSGENAKLNFPTESYAWEIHKRSGCAYKAEVQY
jgi:hypothetical protein